MNYTFVLGWDAKVLPSAFVQVSNCGKRYYPWNGAHASVTVSPSVSAFDLGTVVSTGDNPLKKRGYSTSVDLTENVPFSYTYSITGTVMCWLVEKTRCACYYVVVLAAVPGTNPSASVPVKPTTTDPVFAVDDDL